MKYSFSNQAISYTQALEREENRKDSLQAKLLDLHILESETFGEKKKMPSLISTSVQGSSFQNPPKPEQWE